MRRFSSIAGVIVFVAFLGLQTTVSAQTAPITRRDGFLLLWESIKRPAFPAKTVFDDVPEPERGSLEIDYAASRGIIDDTENVFRSDDPLILQDALIWLFRTRNISDPDEITAETLADVLLTYPVAHFDPAKNGADAITQEQLTSIAQSLDKMLVEEDHEVSLYGEQFHGDGTAFGETFDMHAFTAAHRTFPHNTLVKVTNVRNNKSIIVRINDRGPYVHGRDMDLSVASFTAIEDRSKGKFRATFERLGDASMVNPEQVVYPVETTDLDSQEADLDQEPRERLQKVSATTCADNATLRRRFMSGIAFTPGIPDVLALGETISITANRHFVARGVRYPDGTFNSFQDFVLQGETFTFKPSLEGEYVFRLGAMNGRVKEMAVRVCE